MQIILLLITLASIAFLTIYGAGMYSWSLLLTATALASATCLTYFLKTRNLGRGGTVDGGGSTVESGERRPKTIEHPNNLSSIARRATDGSNIQHSISNELPSRLATKDQQTSRPVTSTQQTSTKSLSRLFALLSSLPLLHIAIVTFILLTLIPLPKPLTIVTGIERHRQNVVAAEMLDKAEALEICKPSFRLFSVTRNRAGTMRVLLLIVAMYGAFEAVRLLSPRNRIIYLHILIAIGAVVAVAGYLSCTIFPQANKLWWMFSVPPFHRPSVGCFLNANHYAGFIAILAVAALGITILNIRTKHWSLAALAIVIAFTMGLFAIISASRGAMLALSAGLFSLTVAFIIHLKGRMRIISILTITVAIGIGTVFALQNEKVRARISTLQHPHSDSGVQPRLAAWGGALRLWTHYPIVGAGANAFRFTYTQHKTSQFRAYRRFAENEFLHILAEAGIIGIVLAGLLLLAIASALRKGIHSTPAESGLAICVAAVLITGATHASVDFILHLPLYAITLSTIIAAGTASSLTQRYSRTAIIMTLLICLGLIPLTTPITKYDTEGYIVTASNQRLASLLTWSPTNSKVWRRLGANIAQKNTPETDALAEEFLEQAAKYDPYNFNIWIKLGKLRLKSNNKAGAKEAFEKATAIRSWAPVPKID